MKKYFLIIFLAAIILTPTKGQDFHYTQYFMSPLGVNPALAGAYNGSYRINGIYRDQYRGAAINPFSGFSLNVDAPIIRGLRKQDWVGVGLRMESSSAGALGQKINIYGLGVAYHLGLNKAQTSNLSIGAQYGTGGYTYNQLVNGDTGGSIIGGSLTEQDITFNTSQGSGGGTGEPTVSGGSLNDLTVGFLYNKKNPKTGSDLKVGIAAEGILNPNRARRGTDRKGIGLHGFSTYDMVMSKRASLTSGAYYYSNKEASAIIVNSIYNYKLKPEDQFMLHGGLGVRNVRAALIYLGATIKGIRIGVAYDVDIGASTPATNNHKSIELGVTYIGKIYKKPKPKPIIYCPRL
ncbi:MAG: PorP/SprF family type IX secretion system membrane protein [Saprospiraceae bacterium]|nr:PorP/SprF family type IX secretion system membrane protein [Saprospiraceae bacterium]